MNSEITPKINQENATNHKLASPRKILLKLVKEKISGKLTVTHPQADWIKWHLYIGEGNIHFANSPLGIKERLSYLLTQHFPELIDNLPEQVNSDYEYICKTWRLRQASLKQVRKILFYLTQEALLHLLILPVGKIKFERKVGLDPLVVSIPLQLLLSSLKTEAQRWQKINKIIASPFCRPQVNNNVETHLTFKTYLTLNIEEQKLQAFLQKSIAQNMTLYEIAAQTRKKTIEIAEFLEPMVTSGIVKILPYNFSVLSSPKRENPPIIACIDDSKSVHKIVKRVLESMGYEVINIIEPTKALTMFVRKKPALILMDISMPEIDGYQLCSLLRRSSYLQDIPVIMLTGRDGMLDRIRSRMVGCVGYISKPFQAEELINVVQSYVKNDTFLIPQD